MGAPRLELDAFTVSTMERSVVGSFTYSADDFRDAVDLVAGAPEIASALISRVVALSDAPNVFAALAAGDGTPGKVLVRLTDADVAADHLVLDGGLRRCHFALSSATSVV